MSVAVLFRLSFSKVSIAGSLCEWVHADMPWVELGKLRESIKEQAGILADDGAERTIAVVYAPGMALDSGTCQQVARLNGTSTRIRPAVDAS